MSFVRSSGNVGELDQLIDSLATRAVGGRSGGGKIRLNAIVEVVRQVPQPVESTLWAQQLQQCLVQSGRPRLVSGCMQALSPSVAQITNQFVATRGRVPRLLLETLVTAEVRQRGFDLV